MAPGDRARAEGRRHPQRPRARRVPDPARRPRTPGLRAHGAAAEQLRRQPQGVAARGPRALLGGALLRAAGRPEPGGHQVLRRGDQVSEGRQGAGSAMGAGEPVRRDGRFPRRPPGVLQADPRVPELRGGGARAAEAERAGELAASRERRCAGVGAPAPLRFGAAARLVLDRAARSAASQALRRRPHARGVRLDGPPHPPPRTRPWSGADPPRRAQQPSTVGRRHIYDVVTMRVIRHLARRAERLPGSVLTLGNFDGAHLGHQAIVRRAVARAREAAGLAVALTFEPHPVAVLAPAHAPLMLQTLHDRLASLAGLGIDVTVVQRFTRAFAALDPEAFVRDFLLRHVELAHVVVGYNVNFGRDRAGTSETLRALGARLGFGVEVVGPVAAGDGEQVSSTRLRTLLQAGDMPRARALLGRSYALRGRVVVGDRRGRTLGFPTANLHLRAGLLLPPDGVYAVGVEVDGRAHEGVLNIGVRPTFAGRRRTIEVHLLDFSGDLYRRWLVVKLIERLRGEEAFSGPEALRAAIARDVERARRVLGGGS